MNGTGFKFEEGYVTLNELSITYRLRRVESFLENRNAMHQESLLVPLLLLYQRCGSDCRS